MLLKSAFVLVCLAWMTNGARILAIFHFPCKSHHILGSALLKALARRGHQITMVSPFPFQTEVENYTDIEITGMLAYKEKNIVPKFVNAHEMTLYDKMTFSLKNVNDVTELFLENPNVKKLLSSNESFDLVIINWAMNEALLAIADHFKAPAIVFSTIGSSQLTNKIMRNPAPYSYIPNLFSEYPDNMNFWQRTSNAFVSAMFELVDHYVNEDLQNHLLKKYFPEAPPLVELLNKVSLVLLNSHHSLETPRPFVPNMIEIGGFHIEEPRPLSGNLEAFLGGSAEGFIFFSLGTNVKSSHLPREKLKAIVESFADLPVKVLWKFEEEYQNLPKNVKISAWLPQTDVLGNPYHAKKRFKAVFILAHPNIKAFVTHGGRLSTIEAIHYGVPIIGIPFFSDQEYNVADSVNRGNGIRVDFSTLTREAFNGAINEILNNPTYRQNAKARSKVLRDQPLKPLDSAIFWVEYVLRHKEASHLKTGALSLRWYERLLLDVLAFVMVMVISLSGIIYWIVKRIYNCLTNKCTVKRKTE